MNPLDDLAIAQEARLEPIADVAGRLGLAPGGIEPYGRDVAKVPLDSRPDRGNRGRYVLVTGMTPTPFGEGKTLTTVALSQALNRIGHLAIPVIRQPSQGPTFGLKGGAAGGGWSQIVPMERLNLHLTGDIHAVSAANNLLAAMVDNHIYRGNELGLDSRRVTWRRVVDVNDRDLRNIVTGIGGPGDGFPRQTGFDITAASEVMAVLALASDLRDLRARLGRMLVGWRADGSPVRAEELGAAGAMTVLMRDALAPNLLQTLESGPALVHAGPFANLAPGTSSIVADRLGLATADYVVTEAGFGADLGAEKFFNIKCRASGLAPDAAVIVSTIRALKLQSGGYGDVPRRRLAAVLAEPSVERVAAGLPNLARHLQVVEKHGVTPVVVVNRFAADSDNEVEVVRRFAGERGVRYAEHDGWARGGAGAEALATAVVAAAQEPSTFLHLYDADLPLEDKIGTIVTEVYGGARVTMARAARRQLRRIEEAGLGALPVCMAKTPLSFTADPGRKGAPSGFAVEIRGLRPYLGGGYITALAGDIRTMPGLPRRPAATEVDLDPETGTVRGLS